MIIIKFSGGLGNQLYQYALYKLLCSKYPDVTIKADISNYELYNIHHGYELDRIFGVEGECVVPIAGVVEQFWHCGEIPVFCGGALGKKMEIPIAWFNARSRKWFAQKGIVEYLDEERINEKYSGKEKALYVNYAINGLNTKKNWYIAGYWQDEVMYGTRISQLCEELKFPTFTDATNLAWKERIEESNSVSIHVRRGDYVDSKYDVITMEYYKQSVKYVKRHVENPMFFVFSEDEDYVKRTFAWLDNKYVISNNRGDDSYKDMQLMSMCRHNIIANSSFSQWAAYLNRHSDKLVLYPSKFTTKESTTEKFENGWVKIDV